MPNTPSFQIITTDNRIYTEGDTDSFFKRLGQESARLESYEHEGDFLVLHYKDGFRLDIPEHRIQYIASTSSADPKASTASGITVGPPIRHSN